MSDNKKPCPRLEMKWENADSKWIERICKYCLVLPLGEYDIRHEQDSAIDGELFVTIGETKSTSFSGRPPILDGKVDTPFRDGAHAQWDSLALGGLPIIASCGQEWTEIENTKIN